jgi:hypothetical protein
LLAPGRRPSVERIAIEPPVRVARYDRGFRAAPAWIDPSGPKEARFQKALAKLTVRPRRLNPRGTWHGHGRDRDVGSAVTARRADDDVFPPEAFLSAYPDEIRLLAETLRAVVRRATPDAIEGSIRVAVDRIPIGRTVYLRWLLIQHPLGGSTSSWTIRIGLKAHLKLRKVRTRRFAWRGGTVVEGGPPRRDVPRQRLPRSIGIGLRRAVSPVTAVADPPRRRLLDAASRIGVQSAQPTIALGRTGRRGRDQERVPGGGFNVSRWFTRRKRHRRLSSSGRRTDRDCGSGLAAPT